MALTRLAPWTALALLLPLASAAQASSGRTLTVHRVDSAVELMNKGSVQLFGARKVFDCETGAMLVDLTCDPCEIPAGNFAPSAPGQWVASFFWKLGNDRDRDAQLAFAQKCAQLFDMYPMGGSAKGSNEIGLWAFKGLRNAGPNAVSRVVLTTGGQKGLASFVLPPGQQDVEITAEAFNSIGISTGVPLTISSTCAIVSPTGSGKAKVALVAGKEKCEVVAGSAALPGQKGSVLLSRAVKLDITYEKQKVDELAVPPNAAVVVLGSEVGVLAVTGATTDYQPDLQWLVEPGKGEVKLLGKDRIEFRLEKSVDRADVVLRDVRSGAEDRVTLVRTK